MPSRRSHTKSRNGCRNCKRRKMKCDEVRPHCGNCVKHSINCDLSHTLDAPTSSRESSRNTPYSGHGSTPSAPPEVTPEVTPALNEISIPSGWMGADALNSLDLELLHNFTISTSYTLSTNTSIKTLWRVNIPKLGFTYPFVMRGILALSALHMAYCNKEKQEYYVSRARSHHGAALSLASSVLPNLTVENCHAMYTFSALTYFFTLSSPRNPAGSLLFVGEGMTNWLSILRGSLSIIREAPDVLRSGILGPLFLNGRRRAEARETPEADRPFEPLTQVETFLKLRDIHNTSLQVYMEALAELKKTFNTVYAQRFENLEAADVLIWVFYVPQAYLDLLQVGTPESLVLLAYFAVLLKPLDVNWWMEGWPTHLISRIYNLLDEECRLVIRWPMEQLGWIPASP